jgi:hypothetical protein
VIDALVDDEVVEVGQALEVREGLCMCVAFFLSHDDGVQVKGSCCFCMCVSVSVWIWSLNLTIGFVIDALATGKPALYKS